MSASADKDVLFRALMAAAIAFLLWSMLARTFSPQPAGQQNQPSLASTRPAAADTAAIPEGYAVLGRETEEFVELGNVDDALVSDYLLHLTLSTRGAGLASARLTEYAAAVKGQERYQLIKPVTDDAGNQQYAMVTSEINFDGLDASLPVARQNWQVKVEDTPDGQQAVFWLDLQRAGQDQPFVRITKTYHLSKTTAEAGHRLELTLRFENLGHEPIGLKIVQRGPAGVLQEDPRMDDRRISAGVGADSTIHVVSKTNKQLKQVFQFLSDPAQKLSWVALGNKFFAVIMAPMNNAGEQSWVLEATAVRLGGNPIEANDASVELVIRPPLLETGGSTTKVFDCYLGAKSKSLFASEPIYAERNYRALIEADYYMCAWGPLVDVMLWLLRTCHDYIPPYNYGVAIIIMVLIVRTLLHPLTKKGQVNMTRMGKQMAELQPKMDQIRKKYGNDKTRMNQEIMKLYQQEGVNPAGQMLTCLPMMCQIPIWGALWAALNYTVEMRHAGFILWIHDLTAPDALWHFAHKLPVIGTTFNLLPPLLGVSMWLQNRFMPKPAVAARQDTKTADQMAQQRLMMSIMSVFMVYVFYHAPSGLTLYIMSSNFFGLIEQHRIRKHLKEKDAAEAHGRDGSSRGSAGGQPGAKTTRLVKKPRFWEKLEKMAEDANRR